VTGYHHGNLREAILDGAAEVIAREGVGALSLRALASGIGVSHTAFRRHFGGREGVLNALAVRGNLRLAAALRAAGTGGLAEVGVAYVRFGLAEPGLFAVMFRTDLLDNDEPELISARAEALAPLHDGVRALGAPDPTAAEVAFWGVVHGITALALTGTLTGALGEADVEALTRRALSLLQP
jgi:AcrR family transcriptional regulator